MKIEPCPNCGYTSVERSAYCPVCGLQLTYPLWKKIGAWLLLILIGYGWVRCNVKFMGGFGKAKPATSYQLPVAGYQLTCNQPVADEPSKD